jgi:hypothetical protein
MCNSLNILCPVYLERTSQNFTSSDQLREVESRRIIAEFLGRMETRRPDFVETVNADYLDNYASKHVEKWVEKVGLHFLRYAQSSVTPSLLGPSPIGALHNTINGRIAAQRLTQKVFSGDVSGSIGEALFALLLRQRYGVTGARLTHLRGTKQTGPSPDFYIRKVPKALQPLLNPTSPNSAQGPVACECKGATSFNQVGLEEKLAYAFKQVYSLCSLQGYGLASIFLRDASYGAYHCLLTVVEP